MIECIRFLIEKERGCQLKKLLLCIIILLGVIMILNEPITNYITNIK